MIIWDTFSKSLTLKMSNYVCFVFKFISNSQVTFYNMARLKINDKIIVLKRTIHQIRTKTSQIWNVQCCDSNLLFYKTLHYFVISKLLIIHFYIKIFTGPSQDSKPYHVPLLLYPPFHVFDHACFHCLYVTFIYKR